MDRFLITTALLVSCFGCFVSYAESTSPLPTSVSPDTPANILNMTSPRRKVSSIVVRWVIPEGYSLYNTHLEANKVNPEGHVITVVTPQLENDTSRFEMTDLVSNSEYSICLYGLLVRVDYNVTSDIEGDVVECVIMSTIPWIRKDSVLAVVLVALYHVAVLLISYLCWRRAVKKWKLLKQQEEEEKSQEGEKVQKNGEKSSLFLSMTPAPGESRPQSDMDIEDIPLLTPPPKYPEGKADQQWSLPTTSTTPQKV